MPDDEHKRLDKRFPDLPPPPEVPLAPRLDVKLPPHPERHRPEGAVEPGAYNKMAIATTAASSFIMPIIVLSVGGWYLDQKLKHKTAWFALAGVIVGMILGVGALLRIVSRLQD